MSRLIIRAELESLLRLAGDELSRALYVSTGSFAQWEMGVSKAKAVCVFLQRRLDMLPA